MKVSVQLQPTPPMSLELRRRWGRPEYRTVFGEVVVYIKKKIKINKKKQDKTPYGNVSTFEDTGHLATILWAWVGVGGIGWKLEFGSFVVLAEH